MMKKTASALLAGWLLLGLAGCGGGGAQTHVEHRGTTLGQELMDLKKAHDQGVISDSDYESQREKLLNRK